MGIPFFEEIHIENTNSCGYKCAMCPRESHTRQIGYMSVEDFSIVLDRIGMHRGVVHLHGFGEPLLDRQLVPKVSALKKRWPDACALIFSTLGVRVQNGYFLKLLDAGLDALVISMYGFTQEDYAKIHGYDGFEKVKQNLTLLSEAKKQFHNFKATVKIPSEILSPQLPIAEPPEKLEFCHWAQSLGYDLGKWNYLHNYSDGRHYNLPNEERLCPVLSGNRRNILNITWDLKVIPCCYDYNTTIPFGDLRTQSLEQIFSSPEYLSFVLAHQTGKLDSYPICQNCEKEDYL